MGQELYTKDCFTLKNNDTLIVYWGYNETGESMYKVYYIRRKKSIGELELEFGSHAIKKKKHD